MRSVPYLLSKKQQFIVGAFMLLFVLFSFLFIAKEQFFLFLIPVGLAVGLMAFLAMDFLLLLIVFLTPLSVKFSELVFSPPVDLDIPTEPILVVITFVFILKCLHERHFDTKILKHPISLVLYFYLFWQFFTTITSSMPIISLKASLSKLWFILPFYFLVSVLFKDKNNVKRYFTTYALSLMIVVVYTLVVHASNYFSHSSAHWVMSPFFRDHTSYGAVLALIIPLIIGITLVFPRNSTSKILYWAGTVLLLVGIVFSYTRAAWLGLVVAFCIWVLMVFRIRIKYILLPVLIVSGLVLMNKDQVIIFLSQNNTQSSTSFTEHLSSMTNISSDASNLERLNRWSCAIRMFEERPIVGWGPGVYMFQYAPFQLADERTIISTNASDLGNAHSEYFGPLAESGFLGMMSVVLLFIVTIVVAIRSYYNATEYWAKQMVLFAMLALITYYVHAFLNNFLDTDKVTALFWACTALIVVVDIYYSDRSKSIT